MHVRLLGQVELVFGEIRHSLPRARTRALLAVLALNAGRRLSLDSLAQAIWGEDPPSTMRAQVHTGIWAIRRALETHEQGTVLVRDRYGYQIDLKPNQIDTGRFDLLVRQGRRALAEQQNAAAARAITEALRLWRGEPLADASGAFVDGVRAQWEERRLAAIEELAGIRLALGQHRDVIAELRALVDEQPYRERSRGHLMVALHRDGRQAEALGVFRSYRQLLSTSHGLDPGAELTELASTILRDELAPVHGQLAPVHGQLAPVHGQLAPVHGQLAPVHGQLALAVGGHESASSAGRDEPVDTGMSDTLGPTAVRDEPVPQSNPRPAGGPAMLPPAIGAFVGREHHLAELDRVLRRRPRTVSTVVISASPGIGKTSLAVHWAHRVRREFPDGQLYVDLRGHTAAQPLRTHEALARLLFGLGVAPNRVPFNTTDAAALYRTRLADRRMLVVLDNARDAEQVRPLLPPGEACFAVVTSRSDMRGLVARDGALPLGLDVLTPTESRDLLAAAIGEDRVAAEETAAADLAGLCAHLPLALRIAAASAETSIAKYVTLLAGGDRLAHLAIPGDEASAIRGAFAVSYQGLPEPARRLFRRLGLVPGQDFTVPAAAALDGIAPERAKELMAILLKGHLVESYLPGRYTFHDLLRDFAFGLCEPGEKDTAVERLFRWYTTHADAAACLLYPELVRLPSAARAPKLFDDAASATEWVTAEQHNIMAVATHAAENGPFEVAWRLADSSRSYLSTQGSTAEWLDLTTAGLRAAEVAGDTMGQAAACLGLGHIAIVTAERPKAVALYLRGLRLAGEAGWLEAQGAINNNLGTIYANMGRMEKAVGHHEQALVIIRRLGTLATEALTLGNLGGTYHRMGRLRHAAATLTEALAAMRRADSLGGQALQLNNLGIVQRELGELDASLDSLTESLSLYRRLGSVAGEAMVMCSLADLHRDAGRHGVALEYAQSALAVPELAGNTEHSAAAGNSLGAVHLAMGNPALALEACAAAVAAARTAGHPELIAESLVGKALALHGTGKSRRALAPASEAVRLARRTGFTILEAQALLALSRAEAVAGEADDARTHAAHAARLFQECGHKAGPHSLNAVRA